MWWPTAEWGECQVKSSLRICLNLRLKESCPCLVLVLCLKPISNKVKHFYRTQVNLRSDLWVRMSVTPPPLWNLTDVMLANEDTNSIPTYIPLSRLYSPRSGWNLKKISGRIGLLELPRDMMHVNPIWPSGRIDAWKSYMAQGTYRVCMSLGQYYIRMDILYCPRDV